VCNGKVLYCCLDLPRSFSHVGENVYVLCDKKKAGEASAGEVTYASGGEGEGEG